MLLPVVRPSQKLSALGTGPVPGPFTVIISALPSLVTFSELLSRVPLGSDRSAEAEDGAMHGQAEEEEQIF